MTDGRATAYSEREREFTFANNNNKWSKNFDERLHHGGVDFYGENS